MLLSTSEDREIGRLDCERLSCIDILDRITLPCNVSGIQKSHGRPPAILEVQHTIIGVLFAQRLYVFYNKARINRVEVLWSDNIHGFCYVSKSRAVQCSQSMRLKSANLYSQSTRTMQQILHLWRTCERHQDKSDVIHDLSQNRHYQPDKVKLCQPHSPYKSLATAVLGCHCVYSYVYDE